MFGLQLTSPCNHPTPPPPTTTTPSSSVVIRCALTKPSHRLLRQLSAAAGDSAATAKLISKFIATSPKSASLATLSHLLSPSTADAHPGIPYLALPFYLKMREASWFRWNPKLAADLIGFLEKRGLLTESENLTAEAASELKSTDRELALFYCCLLDSHSKWKSDRGFDTAFARLRQIASDSSSVRVKRQANESMIGGLCEIGRPGEAEDLIVEMRSQGIKPSAFELKSVAYGYGKLGLFEDMNRIIDQMIDGGVEIDTVCANMVLSSYGSYTQLRHMVSWLKRMKCMGIPFSIRTYNSVLNSCPTIMALVKDVSDIPLSMADLARVLKGEEGSVVEELVDSAVLCEAMEWSSSEAKLDLHGMHLGSAYVIMLQWMEEMRLRLSDERHGIPEEITVVCGLGKHSNVRGESPVKRMVKEVLNGVGGPMRIDRRNTGCFVCKGRVLKRWLCTHM